jgi:hypothetical protein
MAARFAAGWRFGGKGKALKLPSFLLDPVASLTFVDGYPFHPCGSVDAALSTRRLLNYLPLSHQIQEKS